MNGWIALSASEDSINIREAQSFFTSEKLYALLTQLAAWMLEFVVDLLAAFIVWKLGKFAMKWVLKICDKALTRAGVDISVNKFICSILRFGIYAVILIVILDIMGIQTASLIAVFGSAALAISMSLQGSLSNFAGGILILLFKPFQVGDYIIANNCEGTVVTIEILYTKLRTGDNKLIMMPNGALSNSNITNVGAEGIRRLDIQVGIGYGCDIKKAKSVLAAILAEYPAVDKDKEYKVFVKELDASCVTLETRAWVSQSDYWNTKFELLELYKKALDANDIEIPYQQLDVHIKKDDVKMQ